MNQTPSKAKKGFMAYLDDEQHSKLKSYSESSGISMSQLIREAVDARISKGNPYVAGFNKGVESSIVAINSNTASQMRFPSGASFAEILGADLNRLKLEETNEGKETA